MEVDRFCTVEVEAFFDFILILANSQHTEAPRNPTQQASGGMASAQDAETRFPELKGKHKLPLNTILPSQIYTVDSFLSAQECKEVIEWAKLVDMEAPKRPGKGEAERTACKSSDSSRGTSKVDFQE